MNKILASALVIGMFALPFAAYAQTPAPTTTKSAPSHTKWQKNHPRRAEVNHRLANQNRRIHNEVKDGQINKTQAAALHKDDHQIRQEERDMASQDGGHITKQEDKTLNQQENAVSQQIGK